MTQEKHGNLILEFVKTYAEEHELDPNELAQQAMAYQQARMYAVMLDEEMVEHVIEIFDQLEDKVDSDNELSKEAVEQQAEALVEAGNTLREIADLDLEQVLDQ